MNNYSISSILSEEKNPQLSPKGTTSGTHICFDDLQIVNCGTNEGVKLLTYKNEQSKPKVN